MSISLDISNKFSISKINKILYAYLTGKVIIIVIISNNI